MLTCFIRHDLSQPGQYISMISLLVVPVVYLGYYIYAFVVIFQKYRVQSNKEFKLLIFKYLIYSLIYMVFYFPIIFLYILTINQNITKKPVLRWFAYVIFYLLLVLHNLLNYYKSYSMRHEDLRRLCEMSIESHSS